MLVSVCVNMERCQGLEIFTSPFLLSSEISFHRHITQPVLIDPSSVLGREPQPHKVEQASYLGATQARK